MTDIQREFEEIVQKEQTAEADAIESTEAPITEEAVEETVEAVEDTVEEAVQSEPSVEDQARQQGWTPKEEFKGPKDDWVGAEAYLARGPLMKHIKKLNQKLDQQGKTFQDYLSKTEKSAYEKAKRELLSERQKAFDEQNIDKFNEVDEQLQSLEVPEVAPEAPQIDPKIVEFQETHQWFSVPKNSQEKAMRALAIQASMEFGQTIGGDTSEELAYVLNEVKEAFPTHFKAPAKKAVAAPAVNSTSTVSSAKGSTQKLPDARWNKLSKTQKDAANQLKDYGVSIKQYIDTLQESGDL